MNEKTSLGLGLIGCGGFGRFCLESYRQLPNVHVAAVSDVRTEVADEFAETFEARSHHDADSLIADEAVDLVHVATPPSTHHELAVKALRAGRHVLCEKPLALTVEQGREMVRLARDGRRLCPVNFVLRYNRVTEAVRKVIESGVLGRVLSARLTNCATDTHLGPDHWFWKPEISGGIFIEHGVHFFDLYRYWLGEGEVVSASTEQREGAPSPQEDRVTCLVRHADGTLASHYHGFDQPAPLDRTDHRLVCELGDIRVGGWLPLELTVEAAVDDAGQQALREILEGAEAETLEDYDGDAGVEVAARGRKHRLRRRVRLHYCPQPDKPALYAQSLRDLLSDQLAWLAEPTRERRVSEANGLAAVELAERAARIASAGAAGA